MQQSFLSLHLRSVQWAHHSRCLVGGNLSSQDYGGQERRWEQAEMLRVQSRGSHPWGGATEERAHGTSSGSGRSTGGMAVPPSAPLQNPQHLVVLLNTDADQGPQVP